jgi:hypothetical protein
LPRLAPLTRARRFTARTGPGGSSSNAVDNVLQRLYSELLAEVLRPIAGGAMARISDEQLANIERWARWGVGVSERSRELAATLKAGSLHVGVVGVRPPSEPLSVFDGLMVIRPVTAPPGVVHLAGKARVGEGNYLAVARHTPNVVCEIAFFPPPERSMEMQLQFHLCWHLVGLLKLRGHQVHCPVAASAPWDLIAGADDGTLDFWLLDDAHSRIVLRPPTPITAADVAWIEEHYTNAFTLRDVDVSRRFGLAFDLAYRWHLNIDYRVGLTLLWAGLEALFGKQNDHPVTANLAARISDWVSGATEARVRELYSIRCDAVHGRKIAQTNAVQTMLETERLLQDALSLAIEKVQAPLRDW